MADKIVRDLDDATWTRFTGWCRGNKVKVGKELSEILKDFLKQRIR